MSQPIIKVTDLHKKYGDFEAVRGLSFEVLKGEIFGLLGPNGAGKSTTLEIIETLREKTSGQVWVDGFDLDKEPNEIKKIIGAGAIGASRLRRSEAVHGLRIERMRRRG